MRQISLFVAIDLVTFPNLSVLKYSKLPSSLVSKNELLQYWI